MKIEIEKATRQEALQFQVGYRNPIESIAHAFVALNPKALKVINQHIKSHKGYIKAMQEQAPYVFPIMATSTPKSLADSASLKSAVNKFKLFMDVMARWRASNVLRGVLN